MSTPLTGAVPPEEDAERITAEPLEGTATFKDRAYNALNMPGTLSAVLLGADGLIAGGPVNGNEEIERFVEEIAEALAEAGPPVDAEREPQDEPHDESVSEPAL